MIRLGNNEVLNTLTKTLTFVDADTNTNADAGGSTIALPERCSGQLTTAYMGGVKQKGTFKHAQNLQIQMILRMHKVSSEICSNSFILYYPKILLADIEDLDQTAPG